MGGIYSRITLRGSNNYNDPTNVGKNQAVNNVRPPKPTKRKKINIVSDVSVFQDLDEHVRKTPYSAKASVNSLVEYLIRPTKNDLEKVRVIYKYIQLNITYDVHSYKRGGQGPTESKDVLRQGRSVCAGYSNLFSDMCTVADIPTRCITGYAKGLSYDPEKGFQLSDKTNHEWNTVWLSGEWRFVDCTWGTGHVNSNLEFEKRNTDFYFLIDPKYLITSHFPYMDGDMINSLKWQLLKHPTDLETFNRLVKGTVVAHENGVKFMSNKHVDIKVQGETKVVLQFSNEAMIVQAHLFQKSGRDIKNCLMVLKDRNKCTIRIRAPSVGKFKLELYGNNANNNVLDLLVTYIIHCEGINEHLKPFPDNQSSWGQVGSVSEYGISQSAGKKFSFVARNGECRICIPISKTTSAMVKLAHAEMVIKDIENYAILEASPKEIIAKVRTPEVGFYKLTIYGKRIESSDNSHEPILTYLIECKVKPTSCQPFPKAFTTSTTLYQVSLLEPTNRDLPGNTEVTFKFISPVLKSILAANQKFDKPLKGKLEFTMKMPYKGTTFGIYGSDTDSSSFDQLFEFKIV